MISADFGGGGEDIGLNDDFPIKDESEVVEATIASLRARGEWSTSEETDATLDPWAPRPRGTKPVKNPLDEYFDPAYLTRAVEIGCRDQGALLNSVLSRRQREAYVCQADAETVGEAIVLGFRKAGVEAEYVVKRSRCRRWKIAISLPFEEDWA